MLFQPNAASGSPNLEEQWRFGSQLIVPVSSGPRHWQLPRRLRRDRLNRPHSRPPRAPRSALSLHPYFPHPRRLKPLLGPPAAPPGAIDPNTGISVVAPPTFEDEAPAPAATREEVAAQAVSIRSDASSAFGGKADVVCQGLSGPFLAEAVEEVTRIRILETMLQCRGQH